MDFWMPDQIVLDATSSALLSDVVDTARKVREYRPLPADVVRRIEDELVPERVYSSNAIEGNTLDLRETEAILKAGAIITRKKREAREALNLAEAVRLVTQMIRESAIEHSVDKFLEVHLSLLRDLNDQWAGRLRTEGNMITGAKYQPPDPTLVPSLTQRVFEYLCAPTDNNPLLRATWAHWAIARIHPFMDGNGRMARLWQDVLLFQNDFTSATIRPEDRREYLAALTKADEGDFNDLFQMIAKRLLATFDKYLAHIDIMRDEKQWLEEVIGEAHTKTDDVTLKYSRWARMMERLRWEFDLHVSAIMRASTDYRIQMGSFEILDQLEWDNIVMGRSGGRAYWYIVFEYLNQRDEYGVFFHRHLWKWNFDNNIDTPEARVGITIELKGKEQKPSRSIICVTDLPELPIPIQEVIPIDSEYLCTRKTSIKPEQWEYQRSTTPHKIAQEVVKGIVKYGLRKR